MKDKFGPFQDKNVHEDNIPLAFWRAVQKLKEGGSVEGDISLFPHVAAKYVRGEAAPMMDLTPTELAYLLLRLFWDKPELKTFLKETGPTPPLLYALSHVLEEKQDYSVLREWMRDESLREVALRLLPLLKEEVIHTIKEELMRIAQREVGKAQHQALLALKNLVEEDDVKDLFISFLDDWDKEVRKISAMALARVKDDRVAEKAKEALEMEDDPYIAFLMKRLIKKNDEEPSYRKDTS